MEQLLLMLGCQLNYVVQLAGIVAPIPLHLNGVEPEFGGFAALLDMDMRWFGPIQRIEPESETFDVNGRHRRSLAKEWRLTSGCGGVMLWNDCVSPFGYRDERAMTYGRINITSDQTETPRGECEASTWIEFKICTG
jgi:hypothetical protein